MELPFNIIIKILWSILVSIGFAILFNTPRRALWVVGLLGAIGFGIRNLLMYYFIHEQVVIASLAGASAVGVLGGYFAHRVHTPPIVFTVPAVINMVPGKFGYEFIIGLVNIVSQSEHDAIDFSYFLNVFSNGLKAGFILMSLAFGVIFPILIFNTKTMKNSDLHKLIRQKFIRRVKIMKRRYF